MLRLGSVRLHHCLDRAVRRLERAHESEKLRGLRPGRTVRDSHMAPHRPRSLGAQLEPVSIEKHNNNYTARKSVDNFFKKTISVTSKFKVQTIYEATWIRFGL